MNRKQGSSRNTDVDKVNGSASNGGPRHGKDVHLTKLSNGQYVVDAGLKSLDHYKSTLPKWRYALREAVLPIVRWETPYLAYIQALLRSPALDRYFAITANLGTHTFFMIGLPMLFWFGYPTFAKGLVSILAQGVVFTGILKDLLSLPRPLSPPLHRITMSGSAALEYGFPSTHSANAVSVAVYAVLCLRSLDCAFADGTKMWLEGIGWFYAASIVLGRLYCGMHGFMDVIVGSLFGVVISWVEFFYGGRLDEYMQQSSWLAPVIAALLIVVLVRIHPEPADDCPCFDDSVAFSGVMIGIYVGTWRFTSLAPHPFSLSELGWWKVAARIVFGVVTIVVWRETMKPLLLTLLPQVFRGVETIGISLPRRFFVPASEYKDIPDLLHLRTDDVLPTLRDIPQVVKSLGGPTRGRSVSIGPQSAADAYEALAYRETRRERAGSDASTTSRGNVKPVAAADAKMNERTADASIGKASGVQHGSLAGYEQLMGQGRVTGAVANRQRSPSLGEEDDLAVLDGEADEMTEKEMFSRVVKPRVRYDVEVVTKLIVYTGIAWLAVEIIPRTFEVVGLGVSHLQTPNR